MLEGRQAAAHSNAGKQLRTQKQASSRPWGPASISTGALSQPSCISDCSAGCLGCSRMLQSPPPPQPLSPLLLLPVALLCHAPSLGCQHAEPAALCATKRDARDHPPHPPHALHPTPHAPPAPPHPPPQARWWWRPPAIATRITTAIPSSQRTTPPCLRGWSPWEPAPRLGTSLTTAPGATPRWIFLLQGTTSVPQPPAAAAPWPAAHHCRLRWWRAQRHSWPRPAATGCGCVQQERVCLCVRSWWWCAGGRLSGGDGE